MITKPLCFMYQPLKWLHLNMEAITWYILPSNHTFLVQKSNIWISSWTRMPCTTFSFRATFWQTTICNGNQHINTVLGRYAAHGQYNWQHAESVGGQRSGDEMEMRWKVHEMDTDDPVQVTRFSLDLDWDYPVLSSAEKCWPGLMLGPKHSVMLGWTGAWHGKSLYF